MKHKISISITEETLDNIDETIKEGRFRNRSHALEYGLKKLLAEEKDD